ncbi:hypothetical protein XcodCFBP4690_05810 [Xanthomonas codiaei]|uniref:Uncharacterized protein n=1 Tax=Xanthomonas codiaei TaxID=56463 RepID=A0A2S7CU44_9XANT|nr:hypothetical protein XcodCFBP4690_05810 [Xanthomonas codiaei]
MLADRARAERFASLHTNDQIAWVIGARQSALQAAFKAGVLQPGDAGVAEQQGRAFEHAVMKELSRGAMGGVSPGQRPLARRWMRSGKRADQYRRQLPPG